MPQSDWARAPQLLSLHSRAREPQLLSPCATTTEAHRESIKIQEVGTSLVAQQLRIHLPMQGTRVPALIREDPKCCRATKPMRHNY
ncbi:hypothetical protein J1605_006667 [Eschrichtius robustus]|uniref:Uncharacterized protein n=1 Tax=Eschrichtius robustus TaxID=9764 RepID=A0AB34H3S7_ESCRO|nr:hypothetical protein J1605_006667 [Eschrichtius robustus]